MGDARNTIKTSLPKLPDSLTISLNTNELLAYIDDDKIIKRTIDNHLILINSTYSFLFPDKGMIETPPLLNLSAVSLDPILYLGFVFDMVNPSLKILSSLPAFISVYFAIMTSCFSTLGTMPRRTS